MNHQKTYGAVKRALNKGSLIRPSNCQRCGNVGVAGSDGRATIHAHHSDYSKPPDVEWICSKCHRAETPLPSIIGGISLGSANGQAKLTETDVVSARRLRSIGATFQSIADRFGVDKATIIRAVKGQLWKHVPLAAAPKP